MENRSIFRFFSAFLCLIIISVSLPVSADSLEIPETMTLAYDEEVTLAPGIKQNKSVIYNKIGSRMECYSVMADLNVSTVKIAANYKDNQCETYGTQTLSNQVAAAERNHDEPYSVAASVNATYFNMSSGIPHGIFIMDGKKVSTIDTYSYYYFAIMKDGTPRIGLASEIKSIEDDMLQAVSCAPLLMLNGKIFDRDDTENLSPASDPRTCVGITPDNKVYFLVVDGRQAPKSCGISPYQAAVMFKEWGCTSALMLDGGGSCTFGSKEPGEDFTIKNSPSDGGERSLGGTLLIISEAQPTGTLDHINLNCDYRYLSAGSSVKINPVALDSTETPVSLPESGLVWSVSDPSKGSITQDGVFTASEDASGDVRVDLSLEGQVLGSLNLSIVVPDNIQFSRKKISAPYSGRIQLPIKANYGEYPVAVNENDIIAVHEYEYNGSVHESLFESYGYFDGLYFNTPDESIGIKTETLYMIPSFTEDESYISSITVNFYREGEEFFDFNNATCQTDELSYYRTLSNTTTNDDYNYFINDTGQNVTATYKFGIAIDEMEPPDELVPLWDAFSNILGDSVWDAFLTLAGKISSDTTVTIKMEVDPNFELCDLDGISVTNDLFTLNKNEITFDETTNTATFIFRWNESFVREIMSSDEGLSSDAVSPTIIVKDFRMRLKDPALADSAAGIKIINRLSISYDLIAWSSSAYEIAQGNESLSAYAYKLNNKTGIRFTTDFFSGEDKYMLFGDAGNLSGWSGDSYYDGGRMLTGINFLPDKDGGENSFYYIFDSFGKCLGRYTGLVEENGTIRYSQDGTPSFAGLVKDESGNYYYIDDSLQAVKGTDVYIEKTNDLTGSGIYTSLTDGRIVLSYSDGGLISYGEYLESEEIPDVIPEGIITTGSVIGYYSGGTLNNKTVVKFGDVDSDGNADGCDCVLVMCIMNGLLNEDSLTSAQYKAADCGGEMQIDEDDYNMIFNSGLMKTEIDQNRTIN